MLLIIRSVLYSMRQIENWLLENLLLFFYSVIQKMLKTADLDSWKELLHDVGKKKLSEKIW
jgi:hypothetical protein